MVELPAGKMKSREGTVVDADDLMEEMVDTARKTSQELGKLDDIPAAEQERLFEMLGMGALKYFILKVDPAKTMLFNPAASIDFNGNTGPFIQYTHARIKSVLRKAAAQGVEAGIRNATLSTREVELVKRMANFPATVQEAGLAHSPALVANYIYDLAKEFNQYYHEVPILREPDEPTKVQRLLLLQQVAGIIKTGMDMLGIDVPERM
jgi:arginyl-tRNA synthetase